MTIDLSHQIHRPPEIPWEIQGYENPLYSVLDETAARVPNAVFTLFQDAKQTYAQVQEAAERIASFLMAQGIRKGDRVAVFLPNLPQYPPIFFGILKAGAVCVTCNPMYTASELGYQLRAIGCPVPWGRDIRKGRTDGPGQAAA